MADAQHDHITPHHSRYRTSELDLYVNDSEAEHKVTALMESMADFGWKLVSATATAYTVQGYATPYVKYVQYWENPSWSEGTE